MDKICKKCGAGNRENAKYCDKCGASFDENFDATKEIKKKIAKIVVITFAVIVCVSLLILQGMWYYSYDKIVENGNDNIRVEKVELIDKNEISANISGEYTDSYFCNKNGCYFGKGRGKVTKLTINSDGTGYYLYYNENRIEFTWEISENYIVISKKDDTQSYNFEYVSNGVLKEKDDDNEYYTIWAKEEADANFGQNYPDWCMNEFDINNLAKQVADGEEEIFPWDSTLYKFTGKIKYLDYEENCIYFVTNAKGVSVMAHNTDKTDINLSKLKEGDSISFLAYPGTATKHNEKLIQLDIYCSL